MTPTPPPSQSTQPVVVRRWYPASCEKIYRAFTDRDWLAQWFCPSPEVHVEVRELDLRVGGAYRFAFINPTAKTQREPDLVRGEYLELSPPSRLIYTWTWEAPQPHVGVISQVTIEITPLDKGAQLTVTHERLPDQLACKQHSEGWNGCLTTLEHFLTQTPAR